MGFRGVTEYRGVCGWTACTVAKGIHRPALSYLLGLGIWGLGAERLGAS